METITYLKYKQIDIEKFASVWGKIDFLPCTEISNLVFFLLG